MSRCGASLRLKRSYAPRALRALTCPPVNSSSLSSSLRSSSILSSSPVVHSSFILNSSSSFALRLRLVFSLRCSFRNSKASNASLEASPLRSVSALELLQSLRSKAPQKAKASPWRASPSQPTADSPNRAKALKGTSSLLAFGNSTLKRKIKENQLAKLAPYIYTRDQN
jgi:hypothetical protein